MASTMESAEAAAKAGHHPMKVAFPTSQRMVEAGFTDSYRTIHPDEVAKPRLTWSPVYEPKHPDHHLMLIDYVYFKGKGVEVTDAKVVGEDNEHADIVVPLGGGCNLQPSPLISTNRPSCWTEGRLNCSPKMWPPWLPTSPCQIHKTTASASLVRSAM